MSPPLLSYNTSTFLLHNTSLWHNTSSASRTSTSHLTSTLGLGTTPHSSPRTSTSHPTSTPCTITTPLCLTPLVRRWQPLTTNSLVSRTTPRSPTSPAPTRTRWSLPYAPSPLRTASSLSCVSPPRATKPSVRSATPPTRRPSGVSPRTSLSSGLTLSPSPRYVQHCLGLFTVVRTLTSGTAQDRTPLVRQRHPHRLPRPRADSYELR
jgi:hypothetical protein